MTDAFTTKLNLRLPFGALRATATAVGTVNTLKCTDADAADVFSGMEFRIFSSLDVPLQEDVFTVTTMTSALGVTTISFTPAAALATAIGNRIYEPRVPDVTADIADQMETLDTAIHCFACTSSTRPTTLPGRYTGAMIFETDTGLIQVWDGSAWKRINYDPNKGLGYVASTSPAAFGTVTVATFPLGAGDVESSVMASITCNLTINRRYRVTYEGRFGGTGLGINSRVALRLRETTSAPPVTVANSIAFADFRNDVMQSASSGRDQLFRTGTFVAGATGSFTIGGFLYVPQSGQPASGTVFYDGNHSIMVEDIGV